MSLALCLSLILNLSAIAASAPEPDPAFEVLVDSDVYSPEAFRIEGARSQAMEPVRANPFAPPAKEDREEAFAKVEGLEKEISAMDALDRDLLYIRAKNYEPAKLRKIYPKIPEEKLSALQKVLKP